MPESSKHTPLPPIVHVSPGWMVVDKPSGMSVHNDPGQDLCSIIGQYLRADESRGRRIGFDPGYGLHPVHRLDKETSGLILLACRADAFLFFSRQFAGNEVIKHYLALVHGAIPPMDEPGRWVWPLTPKSAGRRNPQGQGRRKPCRTDYQVLHQTRHYTLLRCRLLTGRTHQIRRHSAIAGHPLVGDRRYGSMRACRYLNTHHQFNRLALHASEIIVQPPHGDEPRHFSSDQLPTAIKELLSADK